MAISIAHITNEKRRTCLLLRTAPSFEKFSNQQPQPQPQQPQQSRSVPTFVASLVIVRWTLAGSPRVLLSAEEATTARCLEARAVALAEFTHHSSRGQRMARAGRWVRDEVHSEFRRHPPPKSPARSTFSSTTIACRSSRPGRLSDVRPRERLPRRIVEQIVDSAPVLPLLHVPVPQTVDSVGEVLKILDKLVPDVEQVIEVPKIHQHTVPQRSSLQEPQMAEQLVAVPVVEFTVFRRLEGVLGIAFVRVAGHTYIMRVRDAGWRDTASPGRYTNTGLS